MKETEEKRTDLEEEIESLQRMSHYENLNEGGKVLIQQQLEELEKKKIEQNKRDEIEIRRNTGSKNNRKIETKKQNKKIIDKKIKTKKGIQEMQAELMAETQISIGDPDEEYELHKKEISLENPLGGTIIDGFNISQNRPEDHIRSEVGLREIGGTVEWRKLEKTLRYGENPYGPATTYWRSSLLLLS